MDLYVFVFTIIASTEGFFAIVCALLIYQVLKHRLRQAFLLSTATLGLLLSVNGLKELFKIERPEQMLVEVTGYAFPSGHATGAAFLALIGCYLAKDFRAPIRYLIYVSCVLGALAIGLSRVDLGVHTPLQVLAGFLLGLFWAGAYVLANRYTR